MSTGNLLSTIQSDPNIQYLIPIQHLRPIPSFIYVQDIIEAYPIFQGRNSLYEDIPIPTSSKLLISYVYHSIMGKIHKNSIPPSTSIPLSTCFPLSLPGNSQDRSPPSCISHDLIDGQVIYLWAKWKALNFYIHNSPPVLCVDTTAST
eukprot:TRINITY_DN2483_c0_g1_i10.p1 TRINITY_DN2483_c0_g1~~TRINITY_DN2483_c0_g1_i10.p1  ORF type:complete len:148 (+),score=7.37 TRINITY_DN2483_c0_g1_i10:640-1083(+)